MNTYEQAIENERLWEFLNPTLGSDTTTYRRVPFHNAQLVANCLCSEADAEIVTDALINSGLCVKLPFSDTLSRRLEGMQDLLPLVEAMSQKYQIDLTQDWNLSATVEHQKLWSAMLNEPVYIPTRCLADNRALELGTKWLLEHSLLFCLLKTTHPKCIQSGFIHSVNELDDHTRSHIMTTYWSSFSQFMFVAQGHDDGQGIQNVLQYILEAPPTPAKEFRADPYLNHRSWMQALLQSINSDLADIERGIPDSTTIIERYLFMKFLYHADTRRSEAIDWKPNQAQQDVCSAMQTLTNKLAEHTLDATLKEQLETESLHWCSL